MPFGDDIEKTKEWASQGGYAKAAIYELDRIQQDKMRKILDKDIEMVEKLQNEDEIDEKTQKKIILLQARILKYMDKLHASKSSLGTDPDRPLIINITKEIADQNDITINPIASDNSEGQTQIQSS